MRYTEHVKRGDFNERRYRQQIASSSVDAQVVATRVGSQGRRNELDDFADRVQFGQSVRWCPEADPGRHPVSPSSRTSRARRSMLRKSWSRSARGRFPTGKLEITCSAGACRFSKSVINPGPAPDVCLWCMRGRRAASCCLAGWRSPSMTNAAFLGRVMPTISKADVPMFFAALGRCPAR